MQIYTEIQPEVDSTGRDARLTASLYAGLARCSFLQSGMNAGRMQLQKGLNKLPPTSGEALSLMVEYAGSYEKGGSISKAEKILTRLSGENRAQASVGDTFMDKYIKEREDRVQWERANELGKWGKTASRKNRKKSNSRSKNNPNPELDDLKASYALIKMYEKKSDTTRCNAVLKYIEGKDSENSFVRRRKKNNGSR
jgi:hypothetical protein